MLLSTILVAATLAASPDADHPSLRIGDAAPPMDIAHWVKTPGGVSAITPGDGAIYVIDFWATWCAPCIAGFPEISELQEQYAADGVIVVALSDEPLETVEPFLAKPFKGGTHSDRMRFTIATDPDASVRIGVLEAMSEYSIPQTVVIDRDGAIVWIGHPKVDDLPGVLEQVVAGSWDPAPWRETFEARLTAGDDFEELIAAQRWDDAVAAAGDDWEKLNQIAWTITLNAEGKIRNRDVGLAADLAARAFDLSDETQAFPLHVLGMIAFEQGEVARAVELERRALELEPEDGAWIGYYTSTLKRYEAALEGE